MRAEPHSQQKLIADSFDRVAQTDEDALAIARAIASNMHSGQPL